MKRSHLTKITERLTAAGIEPGPINELLDETAAGEAALREAHKRTIEAAEAKIDAAVQQAAATPADFAELAAEVESARAVTDPARDLMNRAIATLYATTATRLAALWSDTEPAIIAAHDEMMAELSKLAPRLDGVPDDQAAVKAGPSTATAWAKANELVERRTSLIALREVVADVLGLDGYKRDDDLRQYRHPERLRAWHPQAPDSPRHQVTRLLDDIDAGAGPALCTDAEVASTLERTAGERRPVKVHPFAAERVRSEQLLASLGPPERY